MKTCSDMFEWLIDIINIEKLSLFLEGRLKMAKTQTLNETHPKLARQWHPAKNGDLKPSDVTKGSRGKVWWQCEKYSNHELDANITSRTRANSTQECPYCTGQRFLKGFNDLETVHPEIAKEWHPTKNGDLNPSNVYKGSNIRVWWQCEKHSDHEWDATITSRTKKNDGRKCPYCSNKKVLPGYNDLQTTQPEIAKYWCHTMNGGLRPTDVTECSGKEIWWKCVNNPNHIYKKKVASMLNNKYLCTECYQSNSMSFPEASIIYYLRKVFNNVVYRYTNDKPKFEVDIYIEPINLGIEYDGAYWHKNKEEKDINKNKLCNKLDISLLRIREDGLSTINDYNTTCITRNDLRYNHSMNCIIKQVFEYIDEKGTPVRFNDINVDRDYIEISRLFTPIEGFKVENSLEEKYPEVAKLFHPTKNNRVTPDRVTYGSTKAFWWRCDKHTNHEWEDTPNKITTRYKNNVSKTACPYCTGRRLLVGYNDLATTHPHLVKQWHSIKNGDLKPTDVTKGCNDTVWWKCDKNPEHEWTAQIRNRAINGTRCPRCIGR